jgi:hypothetical protein
VVATGKRARRYKAQFQFPLWGSLLATGIVLAGETAQATKHDRDQLDRDPRMENVMGVLTRTVTGVATRHQQIKFRELIAAQPRR